MIQNVYTGDLSNQKPFTDLFKIKKEVQDAITENIKTNGFDESKPIDVWKKDGRLIVIDGNTRLVAAEDIGIKEVPVFVHDFRDEEEALKYAIHNQKNRRNMSDAEIIKIVEIVDEIRTRGGDRKSEATTKSIPSSDGIDNKHQISSASVTARTIGTSERKVEKARNITANGDQTIKEQVITGEKSINKADREIRQKRKQNKETKPVSKPKKVNPIFEPIKIHYIEWAKWTWDVITGCFPEGSDKYKHTYHSELIDAPQYTTVPDAAKNNPSEKNVLVCSTGDLFDPLVEQEWIDDILQAIKDNPQWTFIIRPDNPKRMIDFTLPDNAWVGTTVKDQVTADEAVAVFKQIQAKVKFVLCELPEAPISFSSLEMFDWLILTDDNDNMPVNYPAWPWVESILKQAQEAGCKIYMQENLNVKPKEYPESAIESSTETNIAA